MPAYDTQGGDDFVVPAGATWTIERVRVRGNYFSGPGPATSENVFFYSDAGGLPGSLVAQCLNQVGTLSPNFNINIAAGGCPVMLTGGSAGTRYWLAVQANMPFTSGEWGWKLRGVVGDQAAWENPGGGFGGCTNWDTLSNCFGAANDFRFRLRGIP